MFGVHGEQWFVCVCISVYIDKRQIHVQCDRHIEKSLKTILVQFDI